MDSVRASHPAAPGSILGVPEGICSLDVIEINPQQHCSVGGQSRSLIMLIGPEKKIAAQSCWFYIKLSLYQFLLHKNLVTQPRIH